MLHLLYCGQRVQIASGILTGKKATIERHPGSGKWYSDGDVWIHFDNHDPVSIREEGAAIMTGQWYEVKRLSPLCE